MVKFYLFNPTGSRPLRIQATLSEFQHAQENPQRWFIDLGNCVLEVTKEQYEKYGKEDQHSRYLRRAAAQLKRTQSISEYEEVITYEMSVFSTSEDKAIDDQVIEDLMIAELRRKLSEALKSLEADERYLVVELHINQAKQSKIAKDLGVSQPMVSRRNQKILKKLRKLLDKE